MSKVILTVVGRKINLVLRRSTNLEYLFAINRIHNLLTEQLLLRVTGMDHENIIIDRIGLVIQFSKSGSQNRVAVQFAAHPKASAEADVRRL